MSDRRGPLVGLRVLEVAGIGPAPYAAMLLADMGATVLKIDRAPTSPGNDPAARLRDVLEGASSSDSGAVDELAHHRADPLDRGRRSVGLNLKDPNGVETFLTMCSRADVLLEGFRPGVMERLGIGPDRCRAVNERLVYGRVTGWGREGPLAMAPGHDLNYIALSGALGAMGPPDGPPTPPLNLLGDFAGGGMTLVIGVLAAVIEAHTSGQGQVVDAAMLDGVASLGTLFAGLRAQGLWSDQRGTNLLDGGAHFYNVYECLDGKFLAVGAIEPKFYAALVEGFGLVHAGTNGDIEGNLDASRWPELRARLATIVRTRSRDEWCAVLEGTDACVAPVLSFEEAPDHPHNRARDLYVDVDGVVQPGVVPRFDRTPGAVVPSASLEPVDDLLVDFGLARAAIRALRGTGTLG